jgi:hypothetical protein
MYIKLKPVEKLPYDVVCIIVFLPLFRSTAEEVVLYPNLALASRLMVIVN